MNLIDGRPESDFGQTRVIRGHELKLTKKRCEKCGLWYAEFKAILEPTRAWTWTSHSCAKRGTGTGGGWAQGDGEKMQKLDLPPSDRQALGEWISSARGREDELGDLMAEALAGVEQKLPPEPKRLFELGTVTFSSLFSNPPTRVVPSTSFATALEKHQAGDFGTVGTVADFTEITDDMMWCPAAFGGLAAQAVAIREVRGTIVSGHVVQFKLNNVSGSAEARIETTISPTGNSTTIRPIQLNKFTLPSGLPPVVAGPSPAPYAFGPPQEGWATR